MNKTSALLYRRSALAGTSEDAWREEFAVNCGDSARGIVVCRVGPDGEIAARPLGSGEQRDFIPMGGIEINEHHAFVLRKLATVQEDADQAMSAIWSEQIRDINRGVPA